MSTETISKMHALWEGAAEVVRWAEHTMPDEDLIWKNGHPRQVKDLLAISHLTDLPVRVLGHHRSKSVALPVGIFQAKVYEEEWAYFVTRDNFYDLKMVVVASCPVTIPYDGVHLEMTPDELSAEKQRCFNYCKNHKDFDSAKYETDAWFDGWSRDTLMRVDGRIWRCGSTSPCYYEGMTDGGVPSTAFVRYEHGRSEFAVAVCGGAPGLMNIMRDVCRSLRTTVSERRNVEFMQQRRATLLEHPSRNENQEKELADLTANLRDLGIVRDE